jgi:ribonuclease HI
MRLCLLNRATLKRLYCLQPSAILAYSENQRVLQGSAADTTDTTVNAMELTAVIDALKALKQAGCAVQLFNDSNYVVRGLYGSRSQANTNDTGIRMTMPWSRVTSVPCEHN